MPHNTYNRKNNLKGYFKRSPPCTSGTALRTLLSSTHHPLPQPLATPRTVYFAPSMTVLTLEQGLTLAALPYSLWIASISSVDRLRAAQKTFGPTDPIKNEEDKPSKIKKVVVGVVFFTAYMALFMGVQRLPAWAFEEGMGALAAVVLSVLPAIIPEALSDPNSSPHWINLDSAGAVTRPPSSWTS